MARPVRRRLLAIGISCSAAAVLLPVGGFVWATDNTRPRNSALAIQRVIRDQIAAFQRDDAQGAFAFASPQIRDRFGNASRFIDMVRTSYPMVYRPDSVEFLELELSGSQPVQPLRISDQDGRLWIVRYAMVLLPDKTWRIAGVHMHSTGSKLI